MLVTFMPDLTGSQREGEPSAGEEQKAGQKGQRVATEIDTLKWEGRVCVTSAAMF